MKIGIITFEFNYNYGAILQATALLDYLRGIGHSPLIINRGWKNDDEGGGNLIGKVVGRLWSNKLIIDFKNRYWDMTAPVKDQSSLNSTLSNMDAIITGSDQIWNSACIENMGLYYFGIDALPRQKLIAYAPSFGKNRFETNKYQIDTLKTHFRKFKAISVREDDGVSIMQNVFGIDNVMKVLDPTMLMDKDYYLRLAGIKDLKQKDSLAYYILDNNPQKQRWIDTLSRNLGLKPVNINKSEYNGSSPIGKIRSLRYPSIENWLKNIAESKFVLTDSFHGTVFSIIFNRNCLTFGNSARGNSRFESLLSMFELQSRIIVNPNEIALPVEEISYPQINIILNKYRKESADFLLMALS